MADWIRTCQECGHKQVAKPPIEYRSESEAWRDVKCKKCKSEALDYGSVPAPEPVDWGKDDD